MKFRMLAILVALIAVVALVLTGTYVIIPFTKIILLVVLVAIVVKVL